MNAESKVNVSIATAFMQERQCKDWTIKAKDWTLKAKE